MKAIGYVVGGAIGMLALVLLFQLVGPCAGDGDVDTSAADSTRIAREAAEAAEAPLVARLDSALAQLQQDTAQRRREREALLAAAEEADARARARIARSARQASSVRAALDSAGLCPPWCAVQDSVVEGYEAAVADKDDEVGRWQGIAERFRLDQEQTAAALFQAQRTLDASRATNGLLRQENQQLRDAIDAARGGLRIFGIRIKGSCGPGAGALYDLLGDRGLAAGPGFDCHIDL